MKINFFGICFIILFFFSAFPAAAEYSVRIEPEPVFVQFGTKEEPLSVDDLILLSLTVSGTKKERLSPLREQMDEILSEGKSALSNIGDSYTLGEELLNYLHREVFSRYDENQSSLEQLLKDGTYNCVSSSILYLIFTRYLGLQAAGVATVDHTFCTVATDSGYIDVETTTVYGFDPGTKKEFTSSFGETGFSYVPPGNYRSRWTVGDKKLISYVLQNRISLLERKKQYDYAAALAVDRYTLVRDEETWEDMIKEFVNFAALLNERGAYDDGLSFLDSVETAYGRTAELLEVMGVLVNNKVVNLIDREAFQEAGRFLDEMIAGGNIDKVTGRELQNMVTGKQMAAIITSSGFETALREVESFKEEGKIDKRQYSDYIVYLYGKKSEQLAAGKEWLEAIGVVDAGLARIGADSRLLQAKQSFKHNFAAEKHNEFARLFNSGLRDEALKVLEEALKLMPDSELLRRDYSRLGG